jgi:MFS transporter, Spinster family, sphingosine-1-phosphate transporter
MFEFGCFLFFFKSKSFMWTTMGFTFGSFVMGGVSWWVPTYIEYAIYSNGFVPKQVPLTFGIMTCLGGLLGITISILLTPKLREFSKQADPFLCAIGAFLAVPLLFLSVLLPRLVNLTLFWTIIMLSITSMCLCWTVVADILLYVVHPTRRSIASALNILICHLLGDAISPYIIGAISDALRDGLPNLYVHRFNSLQTALYTAPFFAALSLACYLFAAIYIEDDKKLIEKIIKEQQQQQNEINKNSNLALEINIETATNTHEAYSNPNFIRNPTLNDLETSQPTTNNVV